MSVVHRLLITHTHHFLQKFAKKMLLEFRCKTSRLLCYLGLKMNKNCKSLAPKSWKTQKLIARKSALKWHNYRMFWILITDTTTIKTNYWWSKHPIIVSFLRQIYGLWKLNAHLKSCLLDRFWFHGFSFEVYFLFYFCDGSTYF